MTTPRREGLYSSHIVQWKRSATRPRSEVWSLASGARLARSFEAAMHRADRSMRRHPTAELPRLVATAPNQVWTWDITKLPTLANGIYLALYVVLDLFSRFVVAWTVADGERASVVRVLLADACIEHGISPGRLTVHSDRGSIMKAQPLSQLHANLGIERTLSRPRVSNDNPFSESQFRTTKDDPHYPGRFESLSHARSWCEDFVERYNTKHFHSGLAMLTPADVFMGRGPEVLAKRHEAKLAAHAAHPERFVQWASEARGTARRGLDQPACSVARAGR